MTRPIPPKLRAHLATLPRMKRCEWCGSQNNLEWEHALKLKTQLNEVYAIRALCRNCHRGNSGTTYRTIKDFVKLQAMVEGLEDLKIKYPKHNWTQELNYLANKL